MTMTLRKFAYAVVVLAMVLTVGLVAVVQAEEETWKIDSLGFDYQHGEDVLLPEEWQGDHCTNLVIRWSVRAESDSVIPYYLNDSWDKWTLGLEFHYSDSKANEKPDHGQDAGYKEMGFNVTVKRHFFDKMFYVGWLAGLAYIDEFPQFENRDWKHGDMNSNIGHSHCVGTWGPMIGKDWHIYEGWSLRTEFRGTHTSDPFRSDSGKNFIAGVAGVTYRFK
jgi:hypothetical protein